MIYGVEVDGEKLADIVKPLFYGFTVLGGFAIQASLAIASVMVGLAVLFAIAYVSAKMSSSMEQDWERFLQGLALFILLIGVLFASLLTYQISLV